MRPNIEELIENLSVEELARFTAGADLWTVAGNDRVGIPAITVTDGPNGARGSGLLATGTQTSVCVPCGTALGATWNPELVERVGEVLGAEARTKGARVLLAPTINLHRSPLAGRNFECYSEDPLLTAHLAKGYIAGVQSQGVAATAKHFVGNETEFRRFTSNSLIDQRALRELYLLPFEALVTSGVWALMTSYNRVNGEWPAESQTLLGDLLRGEWSFDGLVMTDWFGTTDEVLSPNAGLDLEMPGSARRFGAKLAEAVEAGNLDKDVLKSMVRRWLTLIDRVEGWEDVAAPERSVDLPEHRDIARQASVESIVLVSNDGLLPLAPDVSRTVALIGSNARHPQILGGGSSQLRPHYTHSILEKLQARYGDSLTFSLGRDLDLSIRPLDQAFALNHEGNPGVDVEVFDNGGWEGNPTVRLSFENMRVVFAESPGNGVNVDDFSFRASTVIENPVSGTHTFTLVQVGQARLKVNGEVVLDGISEVPPSGTQFFGLGSAELVVELDLEPGPISVEVEYTSAGSIMLHGCQVGYKPPVVGDPLADAVDAARRSDVAVLVVGTTADWESEGSDRQSIELPADQNDLIEAVCDANPKTVVIVNSGAVVDMAWLNRPAATLYSWFGGQEMATAIDEVLHGLSDPGGRMPTTVPLRIEHNPSYGSFPGENNAVPYAESVFVGYRWYQHRHIDVKVPFGHGLSYGETKFCEPALVGFTSKAPIPGRLDLDPIVGSVSLTVENLSERSISEVVQVYIRPESPRLQRPVRELVAFAKVHLSPREQKDVSIQLPARAFACWDPGDPSDEAVQAHLSPEVSLVPHDNGPPIAPHAGWSVDAGRYWVEIARSAENIVESLLVEFC